VTEGALSKYEETTTVLTNSDYLIAALSELGFQCEFHPAGSHLIGYEGRERPETAHFILRRHQIGEASNDIGFARKPDGTIAAVLSEYDRSIGFDEKWIGRVQQTYKEKQLLADARAKGYVLRSREVVDTPAGPQVRLQFIAR
jgi:hypothetical protein